MLRKIRYQDGSIFRLSYAFQERVELFSIMLDAFARQCAPQELASLPASRISEFTQAILDRQGICAWQEQLSWQEMQAFLAQDGKLTLLKKEK